MQENAQLCECFPVLPLAGYHQGWLCTQILNCPEAPNTRIGHDEVSGAIQIGLTQSCSVN